VPSDRVSSGRTGGFGAAARLLDRKSECEPGDGGLSPEEAVREEAGKL